MIINTTEVVINQQAKRRRQKLTNLDKAQLILIQLGTLE